MHAGHQRGQIGRALRAADADDPTPVGAHATASGGRLGPRRTTSSRRHNRRTVSPVLSASVWAASGTGLRRLPPKAPPLARGKRGCGPAGPSWRRVRRRRARATTSAGSGPSHPQGGRPGETAAPCCCGPARARRGPGRRGDWGRGRRRPPAAPRRRAEPCRRQSRRRPAPPLDPSSGRPDLRPGRATRPAPGCEDRPESGATHRRHPARCTRPRRWTASPCTGTGAHAGPIRCRAACRRRRRSAASSAASRRTMPGVQKPHWLAPCWTKAAAQRWRSSSGAPSKVVTDGRRRDGRV